MKTKHILVIATIGIASFATSALGAELSAKASALPEELRQGLVLYYSFDNEPSAREIADESGQGNDGHPVNVEWIKDGHQGEAASFGLTNSYITVPDRTKLNPDVLTLSVWIKTSYKDGAWRRIFDKGYDEGYALTMGGDNKEGGSWQGQVCLRAGKAFASSGDVQVTDGRWRHVVSTFDGADAKLYVDGKLVTTNHFPGKVPHTTYDLTIGENRSKFGSAAFMNAVGASFNGLMDDVMMFNRALSDDEVQALFKAQGGVVDEFVDPKSLKVNYIGEKSAKLHPKGFQPGTRNSNNPFAVMDTDDPNAVLLAKLVYFDLRTGSEIHYTVESEKPLTKLIYTGFGFKNFSIEIHDENGSLLTSTGPYNYGNVQKTLKIPLPNVTRFKVVIKTAPMIWLSIKELHFVSGPPLPADEVKELLKSAAKVSDSKAEKPAPTANTQKRSGAAVKPSADERLKQVKQLLDQGLIDKESYDRKVKEIVDSI